ncbi:hypothetical protein TNCV_730671 [Trichonephila clavipes]|nr:hypothetical protein TNCV_730671 [Trichonephila clavipes]
MKGPGQQPIALIPDESGDCSTFTKEHQRPIGFSSYHRRCVSTHSEAHIGMYMLTQPMTLRCNSCYGPWNFDIE